MVLLFRNGGSDMMNDELVLNVRFEPDSRSTAFSISLIARPVVPFAVRLGLLNESTYNAMAFASSVPLVLVLLIKFAA